MRETKEERDRLGHVLGDHLSAVIAPPNTAKVLTYNEMSMRIIKKIPKSNEIKYNNNKIKRKKNKIKRSQ